MITSTDEYGRVITTESALVDQLYQQPDLNVAAFFVDNDSQYNQAVDQLHLNWPKLRRAPDIVTSIEDFDREHQSQWFMPDDYKDLDIAKWILDQCNCDEELQRCGQELLLFQERNLFDLLRYLKYLVDTMREHHIVWGVGRGSSVASFVLYKIGVHRVNSLFYDLDIEEFLRNESHG